MEDQDSPRLGVDLLKLHLVQGHDLAISVEDEEAGACGALVDGTDKGVVPRRRHCVEELGVCLGDEIGEHRVWRGGFSSQRRRANRGLEG